MSKLRVYKVAEQLGMDNRALVALFQSLGIDEVRNHMSTVSADQVERAKRHLSRGDEDKVVEERLRSGGGGAGVIIRRKKSGDADEPVSTPEPVPPVRRAVRAGVEAPAGRVAAPSTTAPTTSAAAPVGMAPAAQSKAASAPATAQPTLVASGAVQASVPASPSIPATGTATPDVTAPKEGSVAPEVPVAATAKQEVTPTATPTTPSSDVAPVSETKTRHESVERDGRAEATPGSADSRSVEPGSVESRSVEPGSVEPGSVEPGSVEPGSVEPGSVEPGSVQPRSVEPRAVEPRAAEPGVGELRAAEPRVGEASGAVPGAAEPRVDAAKTEPEVQKVAAAAPPTGAAAASVSGHETTSAESAKAQAADQTSVSPRSPVADNTTTDDGAAQAARRDPLHTDPIRRVGPPMGPAAAAAARAAERARAAQGASSERPASQVPDSRQQRNVRPAAPEPARPAPKTGIDVWEGRPGVPMPQAPRNSGVPRRVQYDTKSGGQAGGSQAPRRGPGGPVVNSPGGRGRPTSGGPASRRNGPVGMGSRRPNPNAIVTQERAAHKKVVRIEGDVSLQTLAAKMGVKAGEVLMKLMSLGVSGVNINSSLDPDTAKIVGEEFGWMIEDVAVSEDEAIAAAQGGEAEEVDEEREPRPPVVTVMGHVDHGKTSLLDKIRKASVAQGEAGGITQHIGAYSVKTKKGRVTFLDTPGHAAFTQMRARGAKCTDIVVLVVAADDGVMPQTREAVNHAKDAKCPIVVAVNKIDKPDSQPERVRRELSDIGLIPEEWGGETLFCEVSAHSGQGIDELLDAILLQAEVLDLKANPKRHARGTVIEAKLDRGQGPVATVLVTEGTLRKGDGILVGNSWGKVRAMLDENGRNMAAAGPSTPVAVIGLNEVPSAGDMVDAVQDAKKAQQIAEQRRDKLAERSRSTTAKVSLEELARRMNQSDQKELKLIIKGDVQGSVEALSEALTKLSTDKVRVTAVHAAVGAITEGDVNLAVAAKAIILGFNVRPAGKAATLAQKEGIEIRQYSVIYDATDDVLATMQGLLAPTLVEEAIGEAEVRKIFKVSKAGVVAGCMVTNGVVRRTSFVRLRRAKEIIWEGKIDSLKRFKDDAKEVREGFDCGISFNGFSELQEGDVISAFEMKEVRPTL